MNKLLHRRQEFNTLLLIGCLLIIIPFAIFNEVQSLNINTAGSMATFIRMINFFNVTHLPEQSTEAMALTNAFNISADHGLSLLRLSSCIRHKTPAVKCSIKKIDRYFFILGVILLFFIFYQSSRTSSESDSQISKLYFVNNENR